MEKSLEQVLQTLTDAEKQELYEELETKHGIRKEDAPFRIKSANGVSQAVENWIKSRSNAADPNVGLGGKKL